MEEQGTQAVIEVVLEWLGRLRVGEGSVHEAMTAFAVYGPGAGEVKPGFAYRTLAAGIAEGWVQVSERPSASVPELVLVNRGDVAVLVLDGEEIVGGRQNRIVNASFLVGAGQEVLLPVSCVEHGRWHDVSDHFVAGEAMPLSLKFEKHAQVRASLRVTGRATADQGAIWESVARREAELGSRSATGAMHDIYQSRDEGVGAYERTFPYPDGALGLVVAIGGRMAGGDLFDRPATARALWGKLVRSYALDALGREPGAPVALGRAERLLGRLRGARGEVFPSLALGQDVRLEGDGAVGAALVHEGVAVHTSIFRTGGEAARAAGRMASAAARRQMRRTGPVV